MDWGVEDFTLSGAMLLAVGFSYALLRRKAGNRQYKYGAGLALATAFILVWVNGAVGIIGSENNDANMMYFGVLAIGFAGALIARLRPKGMSWALIAMALAQVAVAVIALVGELGVSGPAWPQDIIVLTGFFAAMWLLSAWMFRKASRSTNDLRFR